MSGKKRIWTDQQLIAAIENERSYAGVLRKLGLSTCGGSYAIIRLRIRQLGINIDHFTGQGWCHGEEHKKFINRFVTIPLDQILVKDSYYQTTSRLKKRLIQCGLLQNKCYECNIDPEWNGKVLVLQLDHIDGDRTNNQLENLRILCPNCHSQTDNFCARNKKRRGSPTGRRRITQNDDSVGSNPTRATKKCSDCGKDISRKAKRCKSCVKRRQPTKIEWCSADELAAMVQATSYSAVGRKLGVSGNAVKKRMKRDVPSR